MPLDIPYIKGFFVQTLHEMHQIFYYNLAKVN